LLGHACDWNSKWRRLNPLCHLRQATSERNTGAGAMHRPVVAQELSRRRDLAICDAIQRLNPEDALDQTSGDKPDRIPTSEVRELVCQQAALLFEIEVGERCLRNADFTNTERNGTGNAGRGSESRYAAQSCRARKLSQYDVHWPISHFVPVAEPSHENQSSRYVVQAEYECDQTPCKHCGE